MTATTTGKPVRLDDDIHERLRVQAFGQRTSITRLANELLRCAIPLADAGLFNRPLNEIQRALDTLAAQDKEKNGG